MQKALQLNPVIRAIAVIGAVAALVTGVTFAALTSNSVVLADSNFGTGTASLKIWNTDLDPDAYDETAPGFSFTNITPGVTTAPFTFWLLNDGDTQLNISALGTIGAWSGFTNFALVEVDVNNVTQGISDEYTFAELIDGTPDALPGVALDAGEENQYSLTITIPNDALTGSSASVEDFDWTFTGTSPDPEE